MSRHDEATTQRSDGVFAAHNGRVDAENEPFLTARDLSPRSARRLRSLSGSSSSSSRPSRVGVVRASNGAVGSRLLHALPPRWSQWLQPRTAESALNSASHSERRRPSPPPPQTANAAAASTSTLRVPVTLRVLPGNAPRLTVAPRPPPPSSLHEIRIDTTRHDHDDVNDDDEADDGSLPALVSLTDVDGSPLSSPSQRQHPPSSQPAISPAGSPRSTASSDDTSQSEELSTFDEFQTLFRRCHHTLPFVALFGLYFVYQHLTGLAVFAVGSVAIAGLDQRLRSQIALKENARALYLVGIIAICVVDTIVVSSLDGEPNPFKHLAFKLSQPVTDDDKSATAATPHGALVLELLWIVLVNDFIVRFWSVAVKALVALVPSDVVLCGWQVGRRASVAAGSPVSPNQDLEDGTRRKLARSNVAFYRRKRKLYGIIELTSIFFRSLLAGLPWCSYYQLCGSKFMADVFTFLYVFGKSVILGSQGRRLVKLVRSFLTLGLEHAAYATHDELVEAGSPDCSICYEAMQAPVKLSCGHLFCEECVMEWFDRDRSCPLCRVAIVPTSQANGEPKPQFLDGSTSLFPQLF